MLRYGLTAGLTLVAVPAAAEPLHTLWTFESPGERTFVVEYGTRFFTQRLLPLKLVKTGGAYQRYPAGTLMYAAYTARNDIVYCTYKDRSLKNQASTLFVPMLDKRPCFIDRDDDGRFDASFSVFDKYGSMATPSGDVGDAQALARPLPYQQIDPRSAPETMRIAFTIEGSKQAAKARVGVAFDKTGRDRWEFLVGTMPRQGAAIAAANCLVTIRTVVGKQATVSVELAPGAIAAGDSGGTLVMVKKASFAR